MKPSLSSVLNYETQPRPSFLLLTPEPFRECRGEYCPIVWTDTHEAARLVERPKEQGSAFARLSRATTHYVRAQQ